MKRIKCILIWERTLQDLILLSRSDTLRWCSIIYLSSLKSLIAAELLYLIFSTFYFIISLSEIKLRKRSLSDWGRKSPFKVLKLPEEIQVDSLVFLRISENSESYLLKWDNLRICLLRGLFEDSFRAELNINITGWLYFLSFL
jgi:hypothetical protein